MCSNYVKKLTKYGVSSYNEKVRYSVTVNYFLALTVKKKKKKKKNSELFSFTSVLSLHR